MPLSLRGSNPGPAIDIVGCSDGQANVSRMISRLRLIDGVQHVTLAESSKNDTDAGGATGATDDGECRYNSRIAKFDVLLIFAAPPAAAAPTAAPAAGTAAPASTTTTGSTP